jgi:hypothetical protein
MKNEIKLSDLKQYDSMYKLSKDYEQLYSLILDKQKPICFIDDADKRGKHICWIERTKYGIEWTRNGGDFGCVSEKYINECGSEKQAFINLCQEFDCEWVQS